MRANIRLTLSIGSQVTPVGCPLAARSRSFQTHWLKSTLEGNCISCCWWFQQEGWFSHRTSRGAEDRRILQCFCCYEGINMRSKSAAAPLVKPVCQVASVSCSLLMARNHESQRQVMRTLKEMMECCCQSPSWQAEPLVVSCFWHWNTDTCLLSCWCHRNQRLENSCDDATGKQAQRQNAKKDSVLFLLFRIGPKISPLKIFPEWNIYLTNSRSMSLRDFILWKKQFYVSTRIYTCIYSCLFFFC